MAYSNSIITQNPLEEEKRIKLHNGDVNGELFFQHNSNRSII